MMNDDTKATYWALLMEVEGSYSGTDPLKKLLIEAGYRHWNVENGTKLVPRHIQQEPEEKKP